MEDKSDKSFDDALNIEECAALRSAQGDNVKQRQSRNEERFFAARRRLEAAEARPE